MSKSQEDKIGSFKETTRGFVWTNEYLNNMAVKNRVYGLVEIDVTKARRYIADHESETGEKLSLTGWVVKCLGQAVGEQKEIQGFKRGSKRIVIFDDVDVAMTVERELPSGLVPMGYIVRKANEKTFRQINDEIRAAQKQQVDGVVLGNERLPRIVAFFQHMPAFLRKIGYWRLRSDPFLKKRTMGTVGVTSVGMFGKGGGGWPIPIGFHSLEIAIGGISQRPRLFESKNELGEFLSMTIMIDEEVSYGAPAARFASRLADLMQTGYGLEGG